MGRRKRHGLHPALKTLLVTLPILVAVGGVGGVIYYFVIKPRIGTTASERLLGKWEAHYPEGTIRLHFQKGGKLELTGVAANGNTATINYTFKVSKDRRESVVLHLTNVSGSTDPADWGIELLGDDRMRVDHLTSKAQSRYYDRVK